MESARTLISNQILEQAAMEVQHPTTIIMFVHTNKPFSKLTLLPRTKTSKK